MICWKRLLLKTEYTNVSRLARFQNTFLWIVFKGYQNQNVIRCVQSTTNLLIAPSRGGNEGNVLQVYRISGWLTLPRLCSFFQSNVYIRIRLSRNKCFTFKLALLANDLLWSHSGDLFQFANWTQKHTSYNVRIFHNWQFVGQKCSAQIARFYWYHSFSQAISVYVHSLSMLFWSAFAVIIISGKILALKFKIR